MRIVESLRRRCGGRLSSDISNEYVLDSKFAVDGISQCNELNFRIFLANQVLVVRGSQNDVQGSGFL